MRASSPCESGDVRHIHDSPEIRYDLSISLHPCPDHIVPLESVPCRIRGRAKFSSGLEEGKSSKRCSGTPLAKEAATVAAGIKRKEGDGVDYCIQFFISKNRIQPGT